MTKEIFGMAAAGGGSGTPTGPGLSPPLGGCGCDGADGSGSTTSIMVYLPTFASLNVAVGLNFLTKSSTSPTLTACLKWITPIAFGGVDPKGLPPFMAAAVFTGIAADPM